MTAKPINITVKAVPSGGFFLVECSDCGIVEVCAADAADERCLAHLEAHDVDTTPFRSEMPPINRDPESFTEFEVTELEEE